MSYKSIIDQFSLRVALKKELNAVVVLEQNCGFSHPMEEWTIPRNAEIDGF